MDDQALQSKHKLKANIEGSIKFRQSKSQKDIKQLTIFFKFGLKLQ